MADITADQTRIQEYQAQVEKSMKLSDVFSEQARKTTGAVRDDLEKMASIYAALAKKQEALIDAEKKIIEIRAKENKQALELAGLRKKEAKDRSKEEEERIKQLEKETRQTKILMGDQKVRIELIKKEVESHKNWVKSITTTESAWKKFIDSGKTQALTKIASLMSITLGLQNLAKAAQDVMDISLMSGSFLGLSKEGGGIIGKNLWDISKAVWYYQSSLIGVNWAMGKLGISTEEGLDAFKKFSQIVEWSNKSGGTKTQADRMGDLTIAAGQLSKVLNISLGEATEYMIDAQLRFNRTGEQTAYVLNNVFEKSESYNRAVDKTIIRGRDVTQVLFDISRESKAVAQDQAHLSKMLTSGMLQLQAQGDNYKMALQGASTYVKKMTTDAPDWMKILAGRELINSLKLTGGVLPKTMRDELEKAKPGLAKDVEDIMASMKPGDEYPTARLLQQMLEDTKVGINSMEEGLSKLTQKAHSDAMAMQIIQSTYGVDYKTAQQMLQRNKIYKERHELTVLANKEERELSEEEKTKTIPALLKKYNISKELFEIARKTKETSVLEYAISKKEDEDALQKIKDKDAADKKAAAESKARLEGLIKKQDKLIKSGTPEQKQAAQLAKESFQKQIVELEGAPLKDLIEGLGKRLDAYALATGGYIHGFLNVMKNPLTQIGVGLAAFAITRIWQAITTTQLNTIILRMGGTPSKGMLSTAWGALKKLVPAAGSVIAGASAGAISYGVGMLGSAAIEKTLAQETERGAGQTAQTQAAILQRIKNIQNDPRLTPQQKREKINQLKGLSAKAGEETERTRKLAEMNQWKRTNQLFVGEYGKEQEGAGETTSPGATPPNPSNLPSPLPTLRPPPRPLFLSTPVAPLAAASSNQINPQGVFGGSQGATPNLNQTFAFRDTTQGVMLESHTVVDMTPHLNHHANLLKGPGM